MRHRCLCPFIVALDDVVIQAERGVRNAPLHQDVCSVHTSGHSHAAYATHKHVVGHCGGRVSDYIECLKERGLPVSDTINYFMPEEDIERCRTATGIIHMRTRRKTEAPNRGLETWKDRIAYVRDKGVTARIFATADMKTADDLVVAREGGADGVYVGNVLMNLWNDEPALWKLLAEMQSTIVE